MSSARPFAGVLLAGTLLYVTPVEATKPLKAQLCRGRAPCTIAKVYPANPTVTGVQVRIVELNLGRKTLAEDGRDCRPFRREFWRVVGPANRVGVIKLMTLCNDGYGAAMTLRVGLPRDVHSLTVAFAEAGGGRIVRLTATSKLVAGNPLTLGATFDVPAGGAFCIARNGRLDAVNRGHRLLLRKSTP